MDEGIDEEEWPSHFEDQLSYIGKSIVSWAFPLIHLATTRPLQPQDIPPCPKSQNVLTISGRFWAAWREERKRSEVCINMIVVETIGCCTLVVLALIIHHTHKYSSHHPHLSPCV